MEPENIVSTLLVGLVIGALGRLVVPGRQPIGCLLTVLIGLVGAAIGLYLGREIDAGFWLTLVAQVVVAALLVALAGAALHGRRRRPTPPPRRR